MNKTKSKKKDNAPFKITVKVEDDAAAVQELQLKKKFLEEKYCKI
jgi:hypothetical protein